MNATNLITSEKYNSYLKEMDELISGDLSEGSPEAERLIFLSVITGEYEQERFYFKKPTAIEALKFRMEEMNLKQSDLVQYIGSKSKVSEVLSGKRALSMSMVRALNKYLGIPADVLINQEQDNENCSYESKSELLDEKNIDISKFPFAEIAKRGWIPSKEKSKSNLAVVLNPLVKLKSNSVFFRKSTAHKIEEEYSLMAWAGQVFKIAEKQKVEKFNKNLINEEFLRGVVLLSFLGDVAKNVTNYLAKHGIKFVVLKHLPGTKLDGACFLDDNGTPIVALTLRYDRVDYFWFTLLHELAHVWKHLGSNCDVILDEILEDDGINKVEKEANRIAREALVSKLSLKNSDVLNRQTPEAVKELATQLKIHPAIVAGRIRYELKNYTIFSDLIGQGKVRNLFKEVV